jgi:hypothetical protein
MQASVGRRTPRGIFGAFKSLSYLAILLEVGIQGGCGYEVIFAIMNASLLPSSLRKLMGFKNAQRGVNAKTSGQV